ncbi:MAG: hypothetical protein WDO14_19670 [Bacteroidota bacterium]
MRFKTIVIALLASLVLLGSCATEESCPVAMKSDAYYFRKKGKAKFRTKKKPSPSLIHITRVNYRPGANGN